MGSMDRSEIITLLTMYSHISEERDAVMCVVNCVKLGGEVDSYVERYISRAKEELSTWVNTSSSPVTPPPHKRKYTRRNLTPDLQNEENNTVKIYTEGTCRSIGEPTAKAGVGVFCHITVDGETFTREVATPLATDEMQSNQRAELHALYAGVCLAKEIQTEFPACSIELVVSSMYVYRCIHEWAEGWESKGWKGVRHSDIIRKIVNENTFPCKLIKKDSGLAGYTYARVAATKVCE